MDFLKITQYHRFTSFHMNARSDLKKLSVKFLQISSVFQMNFEHRTIFTRSRFQHNYACTSFHVPHCDDSWNLNSVSWRIYTIPRSAWWCPIRNWLPHCNVNTLCWDPHGDAQSEIEFHIVTCLHYADIHMMMHSQKMSSLQWRMIRFQFP